MAEITAQGVVIEVRPGLVVLRNATGTGETTHEVRDTFGLEPGNYVFVYADGQVEARGAREPEGPGWAHQPPGETQELPSSAPQPDHD